MYNTFSFFDFSSSPFDVYPVSSFHIISPSPPSLQSLLHSNLPSALESALRGDERTALDVMRLVELLLVLIMEGRKALPKASHPVGLARKLESFTGDRNHRQVSFKLKRVQLVSAPYPCQ